MGFYSNCALSGTLFCSEAVDFFFFFEIPTRFLSFLGWE